MHYIRVQPQLTLKYITIKLFRQGVVLRDNYQIINAKGIHIAATIELIILFYAPFDFIDIFQ